MINDRLGGSLELLESHGHLTFEERAYLSSEEELDTGPMLRLDPLTGQRFRKYNAGGTSGNWEYEKETSLPVRLFGGMDHENQARVARQHRKDLLEEASDRDWLKYMDYTVGSYPWLTQLLMMIVLAFICVVMAFLVSRLVAASWQLTDIIYAWKANTFERLIMLVVVKVFCITAGVLLTYYGAPNSDGSGIPEMKAILSGIWIRRYLSRQTLLVKFFSLSLVLGSGLPIGIEGPFIHLSAIIGRQILHRVSVFRKLNRNTFLTAACAVSISATFGTPVGGVLFSIEVTRSYYQVDTYFVSFTCAAIGATLTLMVNALAPTSLILFEAHSSYSEFTNGEIPIYMVIGMLNGVLGALFTHMHSHFFHSWLGKRTYRRVLSTAILIPLVYTVVAISIGDFAIVPMRVAVHDLFSSNHLWDPCCQSEKCSNCLLHDWGNSRSKVVLNLCYYFLQNFLTTATLMCMMMPCGTFGPLFAAGATIGRIVGEVFSMSEAYKSIAVGDYAVLGAATMTAAVTQTLSPAVIAMELTKRQDIAIPVLFSVCLAWNIARVMGPSIYDKISDLRGVPVLPFAPRNPNHPILRRPLLAEDLMEDFLYVPSEPTIKQIINILTTSKEMFFPVVLEKNKLDPSKKGMELGCSRQMILVGEASRQVLERAVRRPKLAPTSVLLDDARVGQDQHLNLLKPPHVDLLNLSPIQVMANMRLTKVYILFHVLRVDKIYVTSRNILIGVITEAALIRKRF